MAFLWGKRAGESYSLPVFLDQSRQDFDEVLPTVMSPAWLAE
ncbi:MAG: hypothetical protein ABI478_07355 [Propionivibrio sp.]